MIKKPNQKKLLECIQRYLPNKGKIINYISKNKNFNLDSPLEILFSDFKKQECDFHSTNGAGWLRMDTTKGGAGIITEHCEVENIRSRNKVIGIRIFGPRTTPFKKSIPKKIKDDLKKESKFCALTGQSLNKQRFECDHKTPLYPYILGFDENDKENYQLVLSGLNTSKRNFCKECKTYKKIKEEGKKINENPCSGCSWCYGRYDPIKGSPTPGWKSVLEKREDYNV